MNAKSVQGLTMNIIMYSDAKGQCPSKKDDKDDKIMIFTWEKDDLYRVGITYGSWSLSWLTLVSLDSTRSLKQVQNVHLQ